MLDIHLSDENRNIFINRVGITNYMQQLIINSESTIGDINFFVSLKQDKKAIHMSRLVELLQSFNNVSNDSLGELLINAKKILEANASQLQIDTTYFRNKKAPISNIIGKVSNKVIINAEINTENKLFFSHRLFVPILSVCPCSKAISRSGAHNQRGIVEAEFIDIDVMKYDNILSHIEGASSCEIYSVLKREDEKYVTESSYENAKFVEDIARDVLLKTKTEYSLKIKRISVTNYESVHNHNAFAEILI